MPLAAVIAGQTSAPAQLDQLIDLLTGVMNDQPITLKDAGTGTHYPLLSLDSVSASAKIGAAFKDAGVLKWEVIKQTDQSWNLWDSVRAAAALAVASNGDMTLMGSGGQVKSPGWSATGLSPLSSGRWVGTGTAAPVSGTFLLKDWFIDSNDGSVWVCTTAGTPGTWKNNLVVAKTISSDTGFLLTGGGDPAAGPNIHRFDPYVFLEGNGQILLRPNWGSGTGQTFIDTNGQFIMTNTLQIPPSAGGTVAATSYGTVPVKIAEVVLGANTASVTFSSIPAGFRGLWARWQSRSTQASGAQQFLMRMNGDTGANYRYSGVVVSTAGAITGFGATAGVGARIGVGAGTTVGGTTAWGSGQVWINHYTDATQFKGYYSVSQRDDGSSIGIEDAAGDWFNATTAAVTSLTFLHDVGSMLAAAIVVLGGDP